MARVLAKRGTRKGRKFWTPEMAGEWTLYIRAYLWNIVDSVEM
jgi:hypothetical protein